ncbi:MAG: hypothetical protein BZY88_12915 [SAR202 cluster bacterium Io17-Chloro-G9]|nr:MAG: hypothetical protein BZY88_12915 [SAR202 cluster bacterium Io17-Chloro-G9]
MFVQVEPADFFMYRVKLIFDLESPDSEDQEARDYLNEKELEPRYLSTTDLDGRQCQIMQFGGCYLGRHLDHLAQIQRRAVETELLTAEIRGHLEASEDASQKRPDEQVINQLVEVFHKESSFQTGENGELVAVLDGDAVRSAASQHGGREAGH